MIRGCCGQPAPRRQRKILPPLPENPKVRGGTRLLYLGTGSQRLRGKGSGLVYYVSERRRHFTADPADADGLLRDRSVILAP